MRIKVETVPPLPPSKVWFSVESTSTISDLKKTLCYDLPALRAAEVAARDIALLLEDFELLDSSRTNVLREGDLVTVKQIHPSTETHSKRKATDAGVDHPRKRVKRAPHEESHPNQRNGLQKIARSKPDTVSSSSESDSSSSDSGSESDVSSNTSSSSEESVPPRASPVKAKPPPTAEGPPPTPDDQKAQVAPHLVPPGQGKPSTHARNARRRKKKQFARMGSQTSVTGGNEDQSQLQSRAASADGQPMREEPQAQESTRATEPPVIMMSSLSNKNKRKGFKNNMNAATRPKIVFSAEDVAVEEVPAGSSRLPFASIRDAEVAATAPFPRLVPPSEKQENGELPENMFVTSVDVEEGLRPARRKKKKVEEVVLDYGEADVDMAVTHAEGTAQAATTTGAPSGISITENDWAYVEENWEKLPKLKGASQVAANIIVAWKALGINPSTFTPEFLLHIGRVISCADALVVEPLSSPSGVTISFGGIVEDGDQDEPLTETHEWIDVLAGDWRVVQT